MDRVNEGVALLCGDCLDTLKTLPDNSVDSVVTDPPYHLTSVVKRFGAANAAPAKPGTDGLYARQSKGFMGKTWDGGDIAFRVELWAEIWRVLKPGGHVLAFSGTRTYHRMVVAIEDAGFEIRDMLGWLYGSGFPKSHDVSKGIDKAAGAVREIVGTVRAGIARSARKGGEIVGAETFEDLKQSPVTVPETEAAKQWAGWGSALKPAQEPIVLARKPLIGTLTQNVLAHGTGGLNIDGCRVEAQGRPLLIKTGETWAGSNMACAGSRAVGKTNESRWPANILHDGSDEVLAAFPETKSGLLTPEHDAKESTNGSMSGKNYAGRVKSNFGGDSGSAARFFYCAKATKADRNGSKHPTVKPIKLMRWLVRLVTPPGGTVLDPFAGSGTTGAAAREEGFDVILCEREAEYVADIRRRLGPPALQESHKTAGITDFMALDDDDDEPPASPAPAAELDFLALDDDEPPCRYCDGNGWFYSMPDLGPCSCRPAAETAFLDL